VNECLAIEIHNKNIVVMYLYMHIMLFVFRYMHLVGCSRKLNGFLKAA